MLAPNVPLDARQRSNQKHSLEIPLDTRGWRMRISIQIVILILTLAIGLQFYLYVQQAGGDGAITVHRPPGVEGFLPIGALMGWKLFVTTGIWDPVHPAAMVIFGFAGLVCLFFRKAFCGWFCPVGTVSEWVWKLGRRMAGKNYRLPLWLDLPLLSLKYLLLGFFVWVIFTMSNREVLAFLDSAYYKVSDVKMMFFFTRMTLLTGIVLTFLSVASFFIRNFWCRYLCPYGALMGILAWAGPTRICRSGDRCIGCGRCTKACHFDLPVDRKKHIRSPECSGCMACTRVCPVDNTLLMKTSGFKKKAWTPISLGLTICILFAGLVYTARITGHWQTRVSEPEFRMLLKKIDSPLITHPGIRR